MNPHRPSRAVHPQGLQHQVHEQRQLFVRPPRKRGQHRRAAVGSPCAPLLLQQHAVQQSNDDIDELWALICVELRDVQPGKLVKPLGVVEQQPQRIFVRE